MPKINFIGIGAQKCGTTWLDACLREHPEIYLFQNKEAHFFDSISTLENNLIEKYELLFNNNSEKIVGEITPSYIYKEHCHKLIHQYNPDLKLIAILRDPTQRAISQYKMEMSRGSIEPNTGVWDAFSRGLPLYGPMRERGLYEKQLQRYYSKFSKEQILILDYEDIKKNAETLIKNVFNFLEVDSSFIPSKLNEVVQPVTINKVNVNKEDKDKIQIYYEKQSNRNSK